MEGDKLVHEQLNVSQRICGYKITLNILGVQAGFIPRGERESSEVSLAPPAAPSSCVLSRVLGITQKGERAQVV